jgi:hypothetical protein
MSIFFFIAFASVLVFAVALPVIFALRKRQAGLAIGLGLAGVAVPVAFVGYLMLTVTDHHDGIFALVVGVPGLALLMCMISMSAVAVAKDKRDV